MVEYASACQWVSLPVDVSVEKAVALDGCPCFQPKPRILAL